MRAENASRVVKYANNNPLRFVDPTGNQPASAFYFATGQYKHDPRFQKLQQFVEGVESTLHAAERAVGSVYGTGKFFVGSALSLAGNVFLGELFPPPLEEQMQVAGEIFKFTEHPIDYTVETTKTRYDETLDEAGRRIKEGDDFGAGSILTERVTAPGATAILTVGEGTVSLGRLARTGFAEGSLQTSLAGKPSPKIALESLPADMGGTVPPSRPLLSAGRQPLGLLTEGTGARAGARFVVDSSGNVLDVASGRGNLKPIGSKGPFFVNDTGVTSTQRGITRLERRGFLEFEGLEVRGARDLSHVSEGTLRVMRERGFSGTDPVTGAPLIMHHVNQNPAGPVVEIPALRHSVWNPRQHPFGNTPGAGLSLDQRAAFKQWRNEYWKARAAEELSRRGLQ